MTNYSDCISKAAAAFKGKSTKGLHGASAGNECVASVQQVLDNSNLAEVGNGTNLVSTFASNLPYSGYNSVSQSSAVPGDIVVLSDSLGGTHVGICETQGCTTMISNSSTPETFSWEDSPQNQDAEAAKADDNLPPGPISYFHHPGSGACPYK